MNDLLKVAASYPGLEAMSRLSACWVDGRSETPGRLLWRHIPFDAQHFICKVDGKPVPAKTTLPLCPGF